MGKLISLKTQKEFDAVNRCGKKRVGKFLIAIIGPISLLEPIPIFAQHIKKDEKGHALLGMKVGRKFGSAIVRNKFKRRIRVIVRNFAITYPGKALIIIPKPQCSNASYQELESEIKKFLSGD